jgi:hypothetical protein
MRLTATPYKHSIGLELTMKSNELAANAGTTQEPGSDIACAQPFGRARSSCVAHLAQGSQRFRRRWAVSVVLAATLPLAGGPWAAEGAAAPVSVTEGGGVSFSYPINVPPGIAGMQPQMSITYTSGGLNGPLGVGWSVQGMSQIMRCAGIRATEGNVNRPVRFVVSDRLCLDGQRLIRVTPGASAAQPALSADQENDAAGLSAGYAEYRTEKDNFMRVRAYGAAGGAAVNGPQFFKVWTKSGQIYEYGNTADSRIAAQGKTVVTTWSVNRIADTAGNGIDFVYSLDTAAASARSWGSVHAGATVLGREWNLSEVRYTSRAGQAAANRIRFVYGSRPLNGVEDREEMFHLGSKNINASVLTQLVVETGIQGTPVAVRNINLAYESSPNTRRLRLREIKECAGASAARCQPATTFTYSDGVNESFVASTAFDGNNLNKVGGFHSFEGKYGSLLGDFNGDGRQDLLRWWGEGASLNQLHLGQPDGQFMQALPAPAGGAVGSPTWPIGAAVPTLLPSSWVSIASVLLFNSNNGCLNSIAVDVNSDGLTDILRQSATLNNPGTCTDKTLLLINRGNGYFSSVDASGLGLKQQTAQGKYPTQRPPVPEQPDGEPTPTVYGGNTYGAAFYLADLNGDGSVDIVQTEMPERPWAYDVPAPSPCSTQVCTRVYLSSGAFAGTDGKAGYMEVPTNLVNTTVYSSNTARATTDIDGDGQADLAGVASNLDPMSQNVIWRSQGNGNFETASASTYCPQQMDFNGDGRTDCLMPQVRNLNYLAVSTNELGNRTKNVTNFNLNTADHALIELTLTASSYIQTLGAQTHDFNGDGRTDIIRWGDDKTRNRIYLSNGDGTFRTSATFNLANEWLRHSNEYHEFLIGDFTGRGYGDILLLKHGPTATNPNKLYLRGASNGLPADLLTRVRTGTGLVSDITYISLATAGQDRYRPAADAATHALPKVNMVGPIHVVADVVTQAPAAGNTVIRESFAYRGMKAAIDGRGSLGFTEIRRQSTAPNGELITTVTEYLQDWPYTGLAKRTRTIRGGLNVESPLLSQTTNTYCDQSVAAVQAAAATAEAPCVPATGVRLLRPQLVRSVESGTDLNGATLPSVSTSYTYNDWSDPLTIDELTSGALGNTGANQNFRKTTTNAYDAPTIDDNRWFLGRLSRAQVQKTVPSAATIPATGPGSAPLAAAVKGVPLSNAPPPPINPAVLSTILQFLLED